MKMVEFWIFPLFCLGMMLFFMFINRDSEHEKMGCMGMMHNSREKEMEKEIDVLKEEIRSLKKVKH
jgi:hypothetical protein